MVVLRRIKTSGQEEPQREEPVTPAGRLFLQDDFYLTAQCIVGFQNPIDLPSLKRELANTFARHPRFSSLMRVNSRGREIWVRTTVNIDDHVIAADLSRFPRDSPTIVEDYAAEVSSIRLDSSKPLWEVHILGLEGSSSSLVGDRCRGVCILVFHHALGDGTSLMSLFLASTRRLDHPELLPTIPGGRASLDRPAETTTAAPPSRFWITLSFWLWKALAVAWFSFTEIAKFAAMQVFVRDSRTCLQGFRGAEKDPSRLSVIHLGLDDLKRIKTVAKATVNDVLVALVSISLQKYLVHHHTGSRNNASKSWLRSLRVRALVLVNTRSSPGLQELNEMMERGSRARWGNSLGYLLVPLSVNNMSNSSPLDHVHHARSVSTKKKLSYEAKFTYSAGALLSNIFGPKIGVDMTYRTTLQTTLSISNIVGPANAVTFAGNPLVYLIPTSAGLPQALLVHMTSYMKEVKIALMGKTSIIPDLDFLSDCFRDALATLLEAS